MADDVAKDAWEQRARDKANNRRILDGLPGQGNAPSDAPDTSTPESRAIAANLRAMKARPGVGSVSWQADAAEQNPVAEYYDGDVLQAYFYPFAIGDVPFFGDGESFVGAPSLPAYPEEAVLAWIDVVYGLQATGLITERECDFEISRALGPLGVMIGEVAKDAAWARLAHLRALLGTM